MNKKKLSNLNHTKLNQVVILAGGLGKRLLPLTLDKPKPMIKFFNLPFLEYIIRENVRNKFKKILILVGYKGKVIEDYFGNGKKFGIHIEYDYQPVTFETGLRLKKAISKIDDFFMLQYCDNFIPFDKNLLFKNFKKEKKDLMLSVYDNIDSYSKSNISLSNKKRLKVYDKTRSQKNLNYIDIGYVIMNKKILGYLSQKNLSMESQIYPKLIEEKNISSFIFKHRYYSVGDFRRLDTTQDFFRNRKKFVLMDRDGVINIKAKKGDYIKSWNEWKWMPNILELLKNLNLRDFKVIVISNQAGIARKKITRKKLNQIHEIMKAEIINYGGFIKDIFVCPHHWDEECSCRKPNPGMFFNAQKKFNIDLSNTYYLGDDPRDEEASKNAGCKFYKIKTGSCIKKFQNFFLKK